MQFLSTEDPLAVAVVEAIHSGNVESLKQLLADNPHLATVHLGGDTTCEPGEMSRSLLHVATDWPGHYPNGPEIVKTLVAAGADVNARFAGPHTETPLHWAASSDDVAILDALLDLGADIEATGAVIGGGTPLSDATAFGQWKAANRLVERGAKASLWQAASLGLIDRVRSDLENATRHSEREGEPPDEVTHAFWCACHGGQQNTAEYLLGRGADINWIGYDELTPVGAASRSGANALVAWLIHRGAKNTDEIRGCC